MSTSPRKRRLYTPGDTTPFRVSRSGIQAFLDCARCFYLDRRLGVSQPSGYPFTLNNCVDTLLKREFDTYRAAGKAHPLMAAIGLDAVPFVHPELEAWRDALRRGVTHHHAPSGLLVTGGLDDVWVRPDGSLIVVDYKATSKKSEVNLSAPWQDGYKRQVEVYQWLMRRNGFTVSPTAYFVYCNGDSQRPAFDNCMHFDIRVLPYEGDDSWVEAVLGRLSACLASAEIPAAAVDCEYCAYRKQASKAEAKGLSHVG